MRISAFHSIVVVIVGAVISIPVIQMDAHAADKPGEQATNKSKQTRPRRGRRVGENVNAHRDLEYATVGGKKLLLDLYVPKTEGDKPPLLVWIHGGGWRNGSKNNCKILAETNNGYAVASLNYRLSHEAIFPAQIHDCKGAIRWLRANAEKYGYNAERIGVAGSSAGGHLVALLGTSSQIKELEGNVGGNLDQSSAVQAVCDFFGPTNMNTITKGKSRAAGSAVSALLGGPIEENKELATQASPATYVDKSDPPFLILHGEQDMLVPIDQSITFEELLKKVNVEVKLIALKDARHGGPQFSSKENVQEIRSFFDKHIKGE